MTRYVKVANVGDGLCLSVGIDSRNLQVDCGSSSLAPEDVYQKMFHFTCDLQTDNIILLSHFHWDHYSGFLSDSALSGNSRFPISHLFYPSIPVIVDDSNHKKEELTIAIMAISAFIALEITGIPNLDIVQIVQYISSTRFESRPLSRGDLITLSSTEKMRILWPPKCIKIEEIGKAVNDALNSFQEALDDNPELKEIHDFFKAKHTNEIDNRCFEIDKRDLKDRYLKKRHDIQDLPETVKKADEKLRKVANRLSLAFQIVDDSNSSEVLFMGDLESGEINKVLENLPQTNKHRFLIAPHHGTHWSSELSKVRNNGIKIATVSVMSFGNDLHPYARCSDYCQISDNCLSTFCKGDMCFTLT